MHIGLFPMIKKKKEERWKQKKKKEKKHPENRSTAPQVARDQPEEAKEATHRQLSQEVSAPCVTQTKDADRPCKGAFSGNMFPERPLLGFHPCGIF